MGLQIACAARFNKHPIAAAPYVIPGERQNPVLSETRDPDGGTELVSGSRIRACALSGMTVN